MDPLLLIAPEDLRTLLDTGPVELIGAILRLNRSKYNNTLNAVVVVSLLLDLQNGTKPSEEQVVRA